MNFYHTATVKSCLQACQWDYSTLIHQVRPVLYSLFNGWGAELPVSESWLPIWAENLLLWGKHAFSGVIHIGMSLLGGNVVHPTWKILCLWKEGMLHKTSSYIFVSPVCDLNSWVWIPRILIQGRHASDLDEKAPSPLHWKSWTFPGISLRKNSEIMHGLFVSNEFENVHILNILLKRPSVYKAMWISGGGWVVVSFPQDSPPDAPTGRFKTEKCIYKLHGDSTFQAPLMKWWSPRTTLTIFSGYATDINASKACEFANHTFLIGIYSRVKTTYWKNKVLRNTLHIKLRSWHHSCSLKVT